MSSSAVRSQNCCNFDQLESGGVTPVRFSASSFSFNSWRLWLLVSSSNPHSCQFWFLSRVRSVEEGGQGCGQSELLLQLGLLPFCSQLGVGSSFRRGRRGELSNLQPLPFCNHQGFRWGVGFSGMRSPNRCQLVTFGDPRNPGVEFFSLQPLQFCDHREFRVVIAFHQFEIQTFVFRCQLEIPGVMEVSSSAVCS